MAQLPEQQETESLIEVVEEPTERSEPVTDILTAIEDIPGQLQAGAEKVLDVGGEALGSVVDTLVGRDREKEDLIGEVELGEQDQETRDMIHQIEMLHGAADEDEDTKNLINQVQINDQIDNANKSDPKEDSDAADMIDKATARLFGEDVEDPIPFTRAISSVGGGLVGGIEGAELGAPFGPGGAAIGFGLGSFTGAVLGTVAPERVQEFVDYSGLFGEDFEFSAENFPLLGPDELETVLEGEAILEVATGGALSTVRAVTKTGTRLLLGIGDEEMAVAKRASEQGIDLLPIQLSNRKIPRGFVTVFGRFPLISGKLVKRGEKAEKQFISSLEGMPQLIQPIQQTADELGIRMFRDAKNLAKSISKDFNRRYDEVFKLADKFQTRVFTNNMTSKGAKIIHKIKNDAPMVKDKKTGKLKPAKLSPTNAAVVKFINQKILPTKGAPQTLKGIDNLMQEVDEFIKSLEPAQQKLARKLMFGLRQQGIRDILTNMRGPRSGEITAMFRGIDRDFAITMTDILETATAKQFSKFTKKGLTGSVSDPITQVPIDTIADKLIHLKSPQNIADIRKLVTSETYSQITAKVLQSGIDASLVDLGLTAGHKFDLQKFERFFGLDNKLGTKYATVKKMLEVNKKGLSIKDIERISEAGRILGGMEIPNAASFVLRRTLLGGIHSFWGSIIPGATAGAAAGARKIFSMETLMMAMMFLGGGRGISAAISNPNTARHLKDVMSEEISDVVRREKWIKVLRLSTEAVFGDPDPLTDAGFNMALKMLPEQENINKQMRGAVDTIVGLADASLEEGLE